MMLGGWGIVVALLALAWGLQMFLAYRQARAFMVQVRRLRGLGRTAIGVSSQSRFKRRTYVALAADGGRVVEAIKISGLTVWARPQPVAQLRGRMIDELLTYDDTELGRAAAMAAEHLRGTGSGDAETEPPEHDDREGAASEEVEHSG